MPVSANLGHTAQTRMPSRGCRSASERVKCTAAPLAAAYTARIGTGYSPAALALMTITAGACVARRRRTT